MRREALLEANGRYHDSQGDSALLRSLAGWAKITNSLAEPSPRSFGRSADRDIRNSLGRLVGSLLQMMIGGLSASGFL